MSQSPSLHRYAPGRLLRAALAAALALTAAVGLGSAVPAQAAAPTVDRIAGANRYATAANVSRYSFAPGVAVAYVATGLSFPDALAGAALAGRDHAPMLLVTTSGVPSETATELRRLAPRRIVVLGGTGVVSAGVARTLGGYTAGGVSRLSGADRYATAARVSSTYAAGVPTAYVATGADFPDALSGSAVAGAQKVPVLLVGRDSVPAVTAAELRRLRPGHITVLGGTGVVSSGVAAALAGYAPVSRIAGADRFATSALVSKAAFGGGSARALMATGSTFADALSGGPVAAGVPGPVLLSRSSCVPDVVKAEITRLATGRVTLLGGTGALSGAVGTLTSCSAAPAPAPAGQVCTNPRFTTSDPNGGYSDSGYYVHNNLWNASSYPGTTGTTYVCSYHSWNHVAYARNTGDGAVKTYPNVHKDYSGRTISSFPRLTSRFAASPPGVGIYNVAYDLWLNGVPNDEVMIWTDNHRQVPAGSRFASNVALSGHRWDVYATSDNGYIAFVPSGGARLTSGTLDLKAMLTYLVNQRRVAAGSTVDQVCYGVEIVDTGGSKATWKFTDFNITDR